MARQIRHFVPNQPVMVLLRGNNRSPIFNEPIDYKAFISWLIDVAGMHRCDIHAYVLMPDHLHLLLTPWYETSLPKLLQAVGRRYVRYFNDRYQRSGTLWEGRYRSALIDSQTYLIDCIRYIEENPVRKGLCLQAADYPWSSAKAHLLGETDHVISDHVLFKALGESREDRVRAFGVLCEAAMAEDTLALIQRAAHTGWPLGSERFKDELEHFSQCRSRPLPRGRPRKSNKEPL